MSKRLFFSLFIFFLFLHISAQTVGLLQHDTGSLDDGYILFAPLSSNTTYLIDKCGKKAKEWQSSYKPGQSVYLLSDGSLLRAGRANNTVFTSGGNGGIIEKFDWNGNLTWQYVVSDSFSCQHHDVKALPNGNVLAIMWEKKTKVQAIDDGRNPASVGNSLWSEKIVEIQPVGQNGGNIVWEWHVWDHLVQDFDSTRLNSGVVRIHPELIDLNFAASATNEDWLHINSIDYNETLDQILLSSHGFNEIWIIDHSTTTAQASTHTGGNSNMGGDLVYRWGNPQAYRNGTATAKKFFGQHNAQWIPTGYPHGGKVLIFNNGNGRTGGNYSTAEIILPPSVGYSYSASYPFLPATADLIYNAGNTQNYYAQNISGAQQLSNGNLLLCNGPAGEFREVDSNSITRWRYTNPVNMAGTIAQGSTPSQNLVFRCTFYPTGFDGFNGKNLVATSTIESTNTLTSTCQLNTAIVSLRENLHLSIYPNPASHLFFIEMEDNLSEDIKIEIYSALGKKVYESEVKQPSKNIEIVTSVFENGVYLVRIIYGEKSYLEKIVVNGE